MKTIVIIEDIREFDIPEAIYARTLEEAFSVLENHKVIDELYLDFDLGDNTDLTEWLDVVDHILGDGDTTTFPEIKKVFVHSMNSVGAKKIFDMFNYWNYDVKRIPLPKLKGLG